METKENSDSKHTPSEVKAWISRPINMLAVILSILVIAAVAAVNLTTTTFVGLVLFPVAVIVWIVLVESKQKI